MDLPKEIIFNIFLHLPFNHAHVAITSIYHGPDCEAFWKQYLITNFHVNHDNVNKSAEVVLGFSHKYLCKRFALELEELFNIKSYPKINYFDCYLALLSTSGRTFNYSFGNHRPNGLIPSTKKRIDTSDIPQTTFDFSKIILNIMDARYRDKGKSILLMLKTAQDEGPTPETQYINKVQQLTQYITPKGIFSAKFDIDVHYNFNELLKGTNQEIRSLALTLSEALMISAYDDIQLKIKREKYIEMYRILQKPWSDLQAWDKSWKDIDESLNKYPTV